MHDNIKPVLRHIPESIILHVDTNDSLKPLPNKILDKILELKTKIEEINKAGNTVTELTSMLVNLNIPIVNTKNISR